MLFAPSQTITTPFIPSVLSFIITSVAPTPSIELSIPVSFTSVFAFCCIAESGGFFGCFIDKVYRTDKNDYQDNYYNYLLLSFTKLRTFRIYCYIYIFEPDQICVNFFNYFFIIYIYAYLHLFYFELPVLIPHVHRTVGGNLKLFSRSNPSCSLWWSE